jgi:hypothetical protein
MKFVDKVIDCLVGKRAHVMENHGNAVVYTIGLTGVPYRKHFRCKLAGTSLLPVEYMNKYEKPRYPQLAHKHMCWPSCIIHILKAFQTKFAKTTTVICP